MEDSKDVLENKENNENHMFGICPECKIRDGDSTIKKLYRCPYCGRWFCEKHIRPKMVTLRDAIDKIEDPTLKDKILEEWRKPDGHPDTAYTLKYYEDLERKKKEEERMFFEALEKLRSIKEERDFERYVDEKTIKENRRYITNKKMRKNIPILLFIFLFIILVILAFVFSESNIKDSSRLYVKKIQDYLTNVGSQIKEYTKSIVETINPDPTKELNDVINSIDIRTLELKLFDRINQERKKYGLQPLKWNEKLAEVARSHSKEMAENNYFSHKGLDCKEVDYRVSKAGIFYTLVGENLLQISLIDTYWYDPTTKIIIKREYKDINNLIEEMVQSWMSSPGHRANILNKDFDETGIGIAIQNVPKYYIDSDIELTLIDPYENTCPKPSKPDKEATLYITQVFISTKCPEGTILCNNKCWTKCPPGYTFVCKESGAICLI